jgi:hypothetical protein
MLMLIAEEVETEARVFAPVAYRRPEAADMGEEVARPPQVMAGVVPPEEMTGQVAVTAVTPETAVEVATHPMPFVLLSQPSTFPPVPAP